jgi:hypothetical protein
MAAPNIVNVATITGKTAVQAVGTSATAIVTNSSGSGKVFKVNALYIANIDGTSAAEITVDLFRSSTAYPIVSTVTVPADASLDLMSKAIYLEEGDTLRCTASAAGDLTAVCSYEEIS